MSSVDTQPLIELAQALVNQDNAQILVPAQEESTGFWFGGGNITLGPDGSHYIVGRYRNYGDSRTGVGAGERGLELAIFRADSHEGPFEKVVSWSKSDLLVDGVPVVSIEGSSLHFPPEGGVELFVSTENDSAYPPDLKEFQKAGTGVWTIKHLTANTVEELKSASVVPLIDSQDPAHLHVKDPTSFTLPDGSTGLIYCNHPFAWSSSNSSLAIRTPGGASFEHVTHEWLTRGPVWDIAVTRITDRMPIPAVGKWADKPAASLYFYCGAESLRQMDDSPAAVKRPRGWSCEEIGGLALGQEAEFPKLERLSINSSLFTSPHGTGCSRYVATLVTPEGIFATWQQSQPNLSQPLVGHFLPIAEVESILG